MTTTERSLARAIGAPGLFLSFEGPEGSGKSTQARRLAQLLGERGVPAVLTREPGGTPFGDKVRSLLLDHSSGRLGAATELSLMLAQRNEHLLQVIRPALERGDVVLADRYSDSSMAYQGGGRGLDRDLIRRLHQELLGPWLPDLTILFDIDSAVGLTRARHGGARAHDRLESEELGFHQRVRETYLALARGEPERFLVLAAAEGPDEVFQQLTTALRQRFPETVLGRGLAGAVGQGTRAGDAGKIGIGPATGDVGPGNVGAGLKPAPTTDES